MSQTPMTADTQRIKLRRALKHAREAAGLQPGQVARQLEWSPSKIIRIEQGAVGVAVTDLQALLRTYGISDAKQSEELARLARNSKRLVYGAYKKVHSETALSLFAVEQDAALITKYSPTFLPGVMQTPEFAAALLAGLGNRPEDVEAKVALRMERQDIFVKGVRHPRLHVVIGEAALARAVGSPEVMRAQLRRVLEFSQIGDVTIQVILLAAGPHPRMGGAFTVLEFDDEMLTTLLYLETSTGESLVREDEEAVADSLTAFERIVELAEPAERLEEVLQAISRGRFEGDLFV